MDLVSINLPRALANWALFALATCIVSCASTRSLDDVLGPSPDDEIRRVTAIADAKPDDAQAQLDAARVLAAATDAMVVFGQVEALSEENGKGLSVKDVVLLDDNLASDLCADILGLASAGMDYAEAAEELGESVPEVEAEVKAEAAYFRGFHLSLVAWGEGSATAALRGRGPALAKLLKRLTESNELIENAGPLRLRARFLDRAPWPYKDRDDAIKLLRQAVEARPVAVNYQFLGDALWIDGDTEAALAAWRAGLDESEASKVEAARQRLLQARLSAAEGSDSH